MPLEKTNDAAGKTFSQRLSYWLIEPRNTTDRVEKRRGRFITSLVLALLASVTLGSVFSDNNIFSVLIIVVLIAYFAARFGYLNVAGAIMVFMLSGWIFPNISAQPEIGAGAIGRVMAWVVLPVVFASTVFSFRGTAIVVLFETILLFSLPIFIPHVTWTIFVESIGIPYSVMPLLLIAMQHRDRIERDRQINLLATNEALRESELNLENRVEERTDELQAALVKLEESDEMKSKFLASMSHELRTPLNAILNFSEMTANGMLGEVNDKQKTVLMQVVDSGKHLLGLINDILDVSKMQSGNLQLVLEDDVDIRPIIENVKISIETLLKDKPVELLIEIAPNLPTATVDRRRIKQILLNLLSNAVKFTHEGHVRLTAKHAGDNLLFGVVDTGAGISKENQPFIFEPFQQTQEGVHQGGTGLGLPISKQLVEEHGGVLWLESEAGEGSSFYFSIPLDSPLAGHGR